MEQIVFIPVVGGGGGRNQAHCYELAYQDISVKRFGERGKSQEIRQKGGLKDSL